MTAPIKAAVFDADGVLQEPSAGWFEEFTRLGGPGFFEECAELERTTLTGQRELEPLLAEALRRRGRTATARDVLDNWRRIDVDPDALALVGRVRRTGTLTALGTNQSADRGRFMQESLGYEPYFDRVFYSCEVGLAKPDPAFFAHIAEQLALPPEQIFFVDDVEENVAAAASVGFRAAHHPWRADADDLAGLLRHHGVKLD